MGPAAVSARLGRIAGLSVVTASAALADHSRANPAQVDAWRTRYWSIGRNAPDEEVNPVLWEAFSKAARSRPLLPVVLDGYPRTRGQALDFTRRGGVLTGFVLLDVDPATALQRIGVRAEAGTRSDDGAEVAHRRIQRELSDIEALLELPEFESVLLEMDARAPVEETCERVVGALGLERVDEGLLRAAHPMPANPGGEPAHLDR
jgi:adenylate kinase family enzyme